MPSGVSNLSQVTAALQRAIPKQVREQALVKYHGVANETLAAIVHATPEDTSHAVGNWQVGLGSAPGGIVAGTDPGGAAALAAGLGTIAGATLKQTINIGNNVDYLAYLLDGSSDQAPADFVNKEVDKVVRRNSK
jgi:hypothetical protein